jgi:hypothetical protein
MRPESGKSQDRRPVSVRLKPYAVGVENRVFPGKKRL